MDALAWLKEHGAATESEYPYQGVQQACQYNLGVSGPKSTGYHNVIPQCTNSHCDDQYKFELDLMLHVKEQGPFIACASAQVAAPCQRRLPGRQVLARVRGRKPCRPAAGLRALQRGGLLAAQELVGRRMEREGLHSPAVRR